MKHNPILIGSLLVLSLAVLPVAAEAPSAEVTAVSPGVETYPHLSPDDRFILYSSDQDGLLSLYRRDLETGEVLRLTAGEFEDSAATWSPNGSKIVFQREGPTGDRDLWEIDADGSNPRNLTATPAISEQHPRYTPDGSAVVFDTDRAETEKDPDEKLHNYEIYRMRLSDGVLTRLTDQELWDMYASVSPDGKQMVWRRALPSDGGEGQNFELFIKALGSGEERNLTNHSAYDGNPHWSPAGDWIVFASTREGSSDIWLIRPDGSELQLVASGAPGVLGYTRPSFSSDGTRITANRVIAGVTDMVIIELLPDQTMQHE